MRDWGMPARPLALLAAALLAALPAPARERRVERTLPAGAAAALRIDAYRGNITVESSAEPFVRVVVRAACGLADNAAAARLLDRLEVAAGGADGVVEVAVRNPRETGPRFFWQGGGELALDIVVTAPRRTALTLSSGGGDLRVGEFEGAVSLSTAAGTISCRHVTGSVSARTERGDIVVSRCLGDIDVATRRGSVRAGVIAGRATAEAVNGDIEILSVSGGLAARTTSGDIAAGLTRRFSGGASARADGGSVTLKIDPAARLDIAATSVWGQVHVLPSAEPALSLVTREGGDGRRQLLGRVNGGGSRIEARASGGQVNLVGEIPPFG